MRQNLLGYSKKLIDYKRDVILEKRETIYLDTLQIEKVVFNKPETIVFWNDGSKTVVKCKNSYSEEKSLALAVAKKALGKEAFYEVFGKLKATKTKHSKAATRKAETKPKSKIKVKVSRKG